MREQEKQDNFLEMVGRDKAEKLQRIWDRTYPAFCSIPYGEGYPKQHTKEEVFMESAKKEFTAKEIELFLSL